MAQRLEGIRARIAAAARRAGRQPHDITLVAVSKYAPDDAVMTLYELGIRDFGESRVQEAIPRVRRFPADCRWHMIGHLQRNKVRAALPVFRSIHSIDSERLMSEIIREAEVRPPSTPIELFIQFNVSGEESKYGLEADRLDEAMRLLERLPDSLRVVGLMTIAPYSDDPEAARPVFARLRQLRDQLSSVKLPLPALSMGMSGDFEVAIEEGATHIRVGSSLFGE
jgi:pyridoxal phosphate enzyme (YggS family)